MSEEKILNICQNCKTYKQPICKLTNEFVSRKNDGCDSFEFDKKKPQVLKKVVKSLEQSDEELKNGILGVKIQGPETPKMNRSKTQRRR